MKNTESNSSHEKRNENRNKTLNVKTHPEGGAEERKMKIGTIFEAPEYLRVNKFLLTGYRINFNSVTKVAKR